MRWFQVANAKISTSIVLLTWYFTNLVYDALLYSHLPLYFMAQFSVYSRYTKFCVSTLKSSE